jgi:transposase
VADRAAERIRHVVYVDAAIAQDGQSYFDAGPPEVAAARRRAAQERGGGIAVPVPPIEGLASIGVPPGPLAEWLHRRFTPHPIGTYETPLRLANPAGNGRPCTYVHFTSPPFTPFEGAPALGAGPGGLELGGAGGQPRRPEHHAGRGGAAAGRDRLGSLGRPPAGPPRSVAFRSGEAAVRDLTAARWRALAPMVERVRPRTGREFRDLRRAFAGVVSRLRTGLPWRDLPARFGPWRRSRRVGASSRWRRRWPARQPDHGAGVPPLPRGTWTEISRTDGLRLL